MQVGQEVGLIVQVVGRKGVFNAELGQEVGHSVQVGEFSTEALVVQDI